MLLRLLRALFSARQNKSRTYKTRSARRRRFLSAMFETLEDRRVFAVTAIVATDDIAPVVGTFSTTTSTNDNQLAIAIQTSDKNSVVDISLFANNGIATLVQNFENVPTDGAGTALINTPTLTDGNYFIRARSGVYAKWFFTCDKGLADYEAQQTLNFSVDTKLPVPVITSPLSNFTNATNIPITVTFSEPVQGFTAGNIAVTNGSVSSPITRRAAPDFATTFSFNVTPTKQGPLTIKVVSDAAHDIAFNENVPSNFFTITYDNTPPVLVSITSVSPATTSDDTLEFYLSFDEPVLNLDPKNFKVQGTTAIITSIVPTDAKPNSVYDVILSGGDLANVSSVVQLQLAPGENITDQAGNPLPPTDPAVNESITVDNTPPTLLSITRYSPANQFSNSSYYTFLATFSEPVSINLDDFVAVGPKIDVFPQSTPFLYASQQKISSSLLDNYNGDFGIALSPTEYIVDIVGNHLALQTPAIDEIYTVDHIQPYSTVTTSVASPTNADPIPITVTFSKPVVDFTASGVALTNGTVSKFTAVSDTTYNIDVAPDHDGAVVVKVPYRSAHDRAGNASYPLQDLVVRSNRTRPKTVIASPEHNPSKSNDITARISFSQNVKGFAASDIQVTNGTVTTVSQNVGSSYDILVTPNSDGPVTINVPEGVASDALGNTNLAATPLTILSDRTAPTVVLSTTATSPTSSAVIPVTATFSEKVHNLRVRDIRKAITNGSLSNLKTTDNITFTFDVRPSGDGPVTIQIPAKVTADDAYNYNYASNTLTLASERFSPTVRLSTAEKSPTSAASFIVYASFSENVTGFDASDVQVANGTLSQFKVNRLGLDYLFTITPLGDGPVTISIPSGAAQDAFGNPNFAAQPLKIISDRFQPTAHITSTVSSPTKAAQFFATVTFSENVTGFTATDVAITNGTLGNFAILNKKTYKLTIAPNADGPVTISIPANAASDVAGNGNTAAAPITIISDRTAPTIALSSTTSRPTNLSQFFVTVKLSEPLKNFAVTDVAITNGKVVGFSKLDAITYAVDVVPALDGPVTMSVAAGLQSDLAGNLNLAATPLVIVSDRTNPTVTIASTALSPTNLAAIPVTINFSENVTGFTATDVQLINGAINNFTAVNGTTYTFDVTPLVSAKTSGGGGGSKGLVTISVPAGVADDTAGNFNLVATPLSIISDRSSPTVALTTTVTSPTNAAVIPVTVKFNEPVTGFALTDVTPTNATLSNFVAVNATTYTFDVTPIADGTVTINLPANVAIDTAGNNNVAALPLTIASDRIAPNVSMTTTASDPTNLSVIPVTVKFNEPVTGFALTDVTPTNATLSNFIAVNATTYTFDVTSIADGAVTINVPAAVATDLAGNSSLAASPLSFISDRTAPTPVITTTVSVPTTTTVIPVTVTFPENVVGFAATDVVLGNGTLSNFKAVNGSTYTFDVTPVSAGKLTVDVPAAAANDVAGNASLAAATLSLVVASPLTATLTYVPAAIGVTSLGKVDIVFSAPVTGVDTSDLVLLVNGSPFNLSIDLLFGTGASYTLNLGSLPLIKGNYSLTLLHLNTGIVDSTNNRLSQDVITTWII